MAKNKSTKISEEKLSKEITEETSIEIKATAASEVVVEEEIKIENKPAEVKSEDRKAFIKKCFAVGIF